MKKGRQSKRKRLNDRGLSLVEVLVAAVVLAVVLVPTLRLFSSSMAFNTKARQHQRAITVAESVMEGFKSYDMESLCRQFGVTPPGDTPVAFRVVPNTEGWNVTAKKADGSALADLITDGKLNQEAQSYEFNIIKTQQEDGAFYDVTVNVTKRAANTKKILDVDCMDVNNDCVIEIPNSYFTDLYSEILTDAQAEVLTITPPADIVTGGTLMIDTTSLDIKEVKRTITITGATGTPNTVKYGISYEYKAEFKYQYISTSGLKTVTYPGAGGSFTGTVAKDLNPSDDTTDEEVAFSGDKLTNVYLYYYPMYKDVAPLKTDAAEDVITFSGSFPADMKKVYVIKQKDTSLSDAVLGNRETSYKASVSAPAVEVVHNYNVNLGGGSTTTELTLTGCTAQKYLSNPYTDPLMAEYNQETDLAQIADSGLMYDVVVSVKKHGETDEVASFIGTMND